MRSGTKDAPDPTPPPEDVLAGEVGARRQILDASASLLRRRGYEGTTVRAIAEAVGIKAASIYHHFPSKDAIASAVVNEGVRVVHDAVTGALAGLPPGSGVRRRLETAITWHLLSSLEHGDYTSASIRAFGFLPEGVRRECREERRRYETVWRDLVADARRKGAVDPAISPDAIRLLLLGAVNWAGEWYRPDRMGIDVIARDFAACVLRGRASSPVGLRPVARAR